MTNPSSNSSRSSRSRFALRILRAQIVFLLVLGLLVVSCSKKEEVSTSFDETDLTGLLPANLIGFGYGDGQNKEMQAFVRSAGYRKYMAGISDSLTKNKAITGDFSAYVEILHALKFMPNANETPSLPFGKMVYFAAREGDGTAFAGYYNTAPGTDGRALLGEVKKILGAHQFTLETLGGADYEGFSTKLFQGPGELPPALKVYRDTLGIKEFYMGASNSRIALGTSRALVERAFAPAKNEAKPFFENEKFKSAVASLGGWKGTSMYGGVDIIAATNKLPAADQQKLPFSVVAFKGDAGDGRFSLSAAAPVQGRTPDQEKYLKQIPTASGALFSGLVDDSSAALTVDGAVLREIIRAATSAQGAANPPQLQMALELLANVKTVSIGASSTNMSAALPYPAVTIAFESGDAKTLAKDIEGLPAKMGMPFPWTDGTVGGAAVRKLTTPFGVSANLVTVNKTVLLTVDEQALTKTVGEKNQLRSSPLIKQALNSSGAPGVGLYMDYAKVSSFAETAISQNAMGSGSAGAEIKNSFESMKRMGKVGILLAYDRDIARITFAQDFTE